MPGADGIKYVPRGLNGSRGICVCEGDFFMMNRGIIVVCAALAVFILSRAACARPAVTLFGESVADLSRLSQDPAAYLTDAPGTRWMSEEAQAAMAAASMKNFFSPWHGGSAKSAPDMAWTLELLDSAIWGSGLFPWPESAKKALRDDARMEEYPSADRRAVAVRNASLRALPTDHPAFFDPRGAGEGFPFDSFQESAVWAGTPLRVLHSNKRGDWLLCETSVCAGWLKTADVAFAGRGFVRRYENGRCAVIVDDAMPLRDAKGRNLCTAHIGAIFPVSSDGAALCVPVRTSSGTARIALAAFPGEGAARWPMPFTAGGVAAQARKFMGAPYGWGGLFEDRDCSATMRDLFIPFGVDLPRNSAAQARSGAFIDLSGAADAEKLAVIRERGIPFRTLICFRGHVGLYLGLTERGEPVMMHSMWGVRLGSEKDPELEGRLVLGRTVITTLAPGVERADIVRPDSLTSRLTALTFLPGFAPEEDR